MKPRTNSMKVQQKYCVLTDEGHWPITGNEIISSISLVMTLVSYVHTQFVLGVTLTLACIYICSELE